MDTTEITPEVGKGMIAYALLRLQEKREEINKINVFPVPDGDTGNNMYVTLRGALHQVWEIDYERDFERFCNDMEEGMLWSISGNAGTISGQFIRGFFRGLLPSAGICGRDVFEAAFSMGRRYAYEAVQEPKEGTMLDVIKAADDAIREYDNNDLDGVLLAALTAAKEDLPKTTKRMKVLEKAGVVDAGAMGFVVILEGLREGMFNGRPPELPEGIFEEDVVETISDIDQNTKLENPYEVQFVIEPHELPLGSEFVGSLKRMGDSLDIFSTSDGSRVRVHIHTEDIEQVQGHADKFGDLFDLSVIDMREEIGAMHEKRRTWIVSDEGADLPWRILAKGVSLVPFGLIFPERREMQGTFYEKMAQAKNPPETSQPSVGAFKKKIQKALTLGDKVLVITISKELSGSYNSAHQAIKMLDLKDSARVTIFDSRHASAAQALLVEKAVSMAEQGREASEIIAEVEKIRDRVKLLGYPRDVRHIIRSGRLKGGKLIGAKLLQRLQHINLHPLLTIKDGNIKVNSLSFGGDFAKNLYNGLIGMNSASESNSMVGMCYAIAHADNTEQAETLKELLQSRGASVHILQPLNRVIGSRTGPGCLIVAWYEE